MLGHVHYYRINLRNFLISHHTYELTYKKRVQILTEILHNFKGYLFQIGIHLA